LQDGKSSGLERREGVTDLVFGKATI
jgi:hypothetical protein